MIKGDLTSFVSLIQETVETNFPAVKAFIYGHANKVIAASKSNTYPIIHLARPMIETIGNGFGAPNTVFYAEITAITKVNLSGMQATHNSNELEADNLALNMVLELETHLRDKAREFEFEFKLLSEFEPLIPGWIDQVVGWKMTCQITLGANVQIG
ncbi:hypothetical protein HME7025_00101 [Aquirufa nivalisilvae]|uniref:Uncharacterized protein n=1 Tax=Aquirufa nivalisilvae TaxID=2516557 RepID=A0A2S2DRI0_9BACT|nr:hypothetical protein [Aquirufa nivalisilvae]AWL07986.1 hypothetical protein HME7025_00101 [Aquirufa nivalisilvae]